MLKQIANLHEIPNGAVSIRKNGKGELIKSTANIQIKKNVFDKLEDMDVDVYTSLQLTDEQMEELVDAVAESFGHCEDFGSLAEPLGIYIAKDSLSDFIEDKYEEIINKPKWYEISVELQGTHTIYVKANSEDDAREAVLNYDVEFKDDIDLDDLDYSIDSIDEYYDEEPPHWASYYDVTE